MAPCWKPKTTKAAGKSANENFKSTAEMIEGAESKRIKTLWRFGNVTDTGGKVTVQWFQTKEVGSGNLCMAAFFVLSFFFCDG